MKVLFRTDASQKIGLGHLMRCLTLAGEIRKRGGQATFVCRKLTHEVAATVRHQGFQLIELGRIGDPHAGDLAHSHWLGIPQEEDAKETLAAAGHDFDLAVVDHYALDRRWEDQVRTGGVKKILAIDDIADREHNVEWLLDQNLYSDAATRYEKFISVSTKQLLGPAYSLLREEFARERATVKAREGVRRVLVFYGGTDATGETLKALDALDILKTFSADVVVGPSNPRLAEIRARCDANSAYQFHFHVDYMARLMAAADFSMGAGGTTTWERCCLGLPTLVTAVADNQVVMSAEGERVGFQIYMGRAAEVTAVDLAERLKCFGGKPSHVLATSEKALATVDGKGAARVVDALSGLA